MLLMLMETPFSASLFVINVQQKYSLILSPPTMLTRTS